MRTLRYSFLAALAAATLLTGCSSAGVGDIFGDRDPNPSTSDDNWVSGDLRGTIERVDTSSRYIVVDAESMTRTDLRNGDDEVVLYYDDRTTVQHEGRSYRPQDLERGDRIAAEIERSGDRFFVEEIEVLYDVTGDSGSGGVLDDDDDDVRTADLRGTVRSVDTRDRTLEVESARYSSSFSTTGRANDVVVVHYDANTTVEFQGRRYGPENLERGDSVEIELRDLGSRLLAEEIEVVGEGYPIGR